MLVHEFVCEYVLVYGKIHFRVLSIPLVGLFVFESRGSERVRNYGFWSFSFYSQCFLCRFSHFFSILQFVQHMCNMSPDWLT